MTPGVRGVDVGAATAHGTAGAKQVRSLALRRAAGMAVIARH
jgi:hypothetical protein